MVIINDDKLYDKALMLAQYYSNEQRRVVEIFVDIVLSAAFYWDGISSDDFCIQSMEAGGVIFGGTNRLIWSPAHGFQADRSYCTERFLARYDSLGRLPGKPANQEETAWVPRRGRDV